MRAFFAGIVWLLTPTYADYNANPIIYWIKICITGTFWAFVTIGLVGAYIIYTDGEA